MSLAVRASKLLFPLFFIGAGSIHFVLTDFYVQRIPEPVPYRRELVLAAGVLEVVAAGLAFRDSSRKVASRVIMVFLLCVVQVNIVQNLRGLSPDQLPPLVLWARVGFLLLLSGWAYLNSTLGPAPAAAAAAAR